MARNFYISDTASKYMDRLNRNSRSGMIEYRLHFWWLCAQVGLLKNNSSETVSNPRDMVDHFDIGPLRASQNYIRALLLMQHIRDIDAGGMNRGMIEGIMQQTMTSESASRLTEDGSKLLDRYAETGFRIIRDEIGSQDELKDFLREYHNLIERLGGSERPLR